MYSFDIKNHKTLEVRLIISFKEIKKIFVIFNQTVELISLKTLFNIHI